MDTLLFIMWTTLVLCYYNMVSRKVTHATSNLHLQLSRNALPTGT